MKVSIEGPKIRLRDLERTDLETYRKWQQPGHKWQRLDGPYYPKPTAEQIDEMILKLTSRVESASWPDVRQRLMVADKTSNALLGLVSRYWVSEETNWSAIGIVLFDPASWGKGIGYEALGLWNDYLFRAFPEWVRLDLRTWSGNLGMMGLAKKLGYREEARFRQARIVGGEYFDGLGYGILRDEWQAQFPSGFAASLE